MRLPHIRLTPTRRRTLIGSGLFAAVAALTAPAVGAPLAATPKSGTVAGSQTSSAIARVGAAGTALATDSHLGRSVSVRHQLAVQAERALAAQLRASKARALAAKRASRARAFRLRVWRSSHARMVPVSTSYRLSARFGDRSGLWGSGRHTGLDFDAPYGSPIRATRLGVVSFAGWDGPYGNCVVLNHGHGLQTKYAHMSHISVRVGQRVWAGQQVGRLGGTGNTTGPHLHFEVIKNGKPVNPAAWLW